MLVELQEEEINKVINLINIANKAVGVSISLDCHNLAVKLETAKQKPVAKTQDVSPTQDIYPIEGV